MSAAKQNKGDLANEIAYYIQDDEIYEEMLKNGLLKLIVGKKGQSDFEKLRLDKKGKKLLEDLEEVGVTENDERMFNYLCEMYLNNEDEERHIGNKKKTLKYCTEFRQIMGLDLYQMYWLCWFFLQEHSFTKKLEYIFFNSNKHRYGTFKGNLEDSPLYQFLDEKKEDIEKLWENKINAKN